VQTFNELIDYVISNDIDKVSSEFKNKVQKIFADNSGNIYDYSVFTLLLPGMINYLAGILNRPKFAANTPLGFLPKDVDFFPLKANETWANVIKIAENEKSVKLNDISSIPYKTTGFNYGDVNFPLSKSALTTKTSVIKTPTVSFKFNYIPNITFTKDNFEYDTTYLDSEYGRTYQTTKIYPWTDKRALTSAVWVAGKDLQIYTCFPGCTACHPTDCGVWGTRQKTICKKSWWYKFGTERVCEKCGSKMEDEKYCDRPADVMATEKQTPEKTAANASEELKAMNVAKSDVTNPLQPLPLTPHTPDNKT
jgi:hypothetical protein